MLDANLGSFTFLFKKKRFFLFCSILLLLKIDVSAQLIDTTRAMEPDSALVAFSTDSTMVDSLFQSTLFDSSLTQKKSDIAIYPWPTKLDFGHFLVASDSLLRWHYASDLADVFAINNLGLPNRSGIQMRSDAFVLGTNTTRFQQLNWEGIPMDEPLSGTPMYEMLPTNKLASLQFSQQSGLQHTSFTNRTYQVNEPWSSLYFDEADGKYQNLAFSLTRNFNRRHNTELGYKQLRDGSLFRLSQSEANQIFLQNTYDLTQKIQLTQRWFSNQTKVDEPFGYAFTDAALFNFNPFSSNPNQNARQELNLSMHSFGVKLRSDSVSAAHTHLQFYLKNTTRALSVAADTIDYKVREFGLSSTNNLTLPNALGELKSSSVFRFFRPDGTFLSQNLTEKWIDVSFKTTWQKALKKALGKLSVGAELGYTTLADNYQTYAIHAGIYDIKIPFFGQLSTSTYQRTDAPNWVELQRSAEPILASTFQLSRFKSQGVDIRLHKRLNNFWFIQASTAYKQTLDLPKLQGLYLDASNESTWGSLETIAGSFALHWQATTFYAKYQTDFYRISEKNGNYEDQRLLSTSQVGWKNYAFNKATYIDFSVELRNEVLPFYGQTRDPLTHLWQLQNTDQIPAYTSVLDFRLSARLRSIMILVRYENTLDAQAQLGYFETLGYPAPARRLLFSVRALFKN